MERLTNIRDGHGAVINSTRGSSCLLLLRFVSLMYSCPFRLVNSLAFSPYTGGPITKDHENTVKAYSASPSVMLGRGQSLVEPQGPVQVRKVSTEVHPHFLFFFASNGRWRYRWDLLDNKFVENNGTRRHGGMYSIASFETSILTLLRKKLFMPMVYKIFQMNYN